jgi:ABC-type Fe3+ transport system permease subunit
MGRGGLTSDVSTLLHSLSVALGAAALAGGLGLAAAVTLLLWEGWTRRCVLIATAASLAMPPFLTANCWLELTDRWRLAWPVEQAAVAGLPLVAVVLALGLWPIMTLWVWGAWQALEPGWLEADPRQRGRWLWRGVLWPLARPSAGPALAVIAFLALTNFSVPVLFQVRVLTEEMWVRVNTRFDTPGACLAAIPQLVAGFGLAFLLHRRADAWPRRDTRVSAATIRRQAGLVWASAALGLTGIGVGLGVVLPLAQLAFEARTWRELPGAWEAGHLAVGNTAIAGGVSASLATALALWFAGGIEHKARGPGPIWMLFLAPGVLLASAAIWAFNRPGSAAFYGSFGIVLLMLTARFLPVVWAVAAAALRATDRDLIEAARQHAGSRWAVFRTAVWPQVRGSVATAWYATYLLCLWEVESVILLVPPGGETLAMRIFNLLHYGHAAQVNALCVILLGLALAPLLVWSAVQALRNRGGAARFAGLAALGWVVGCDSGAPSEDSTPLNSAFFSEARVIGSRGVGPGHFNKPRSVVCDRDDNLYVVDMTGRVQKFDPDGRFILQWQMPETDRGRPKGMGLDSDGLILVVEPHYQRINHFTPEGRLVRQWGRHGTNAGEFILPRGVVQNARGEFFVSEYTLVERVQRFSSGGVSNAPMLLGGWGGPGLEPGRFNRPEGLALGPDEAVYVADSCNHRIQVFTADGRLLRAHGRAGAAPGTLSYPYDVRVDAAGRQFVCEFGNSRISVFESDDRLIEVIGGAGNSPGRFANPWGIAFDSRGNLYVADAMNHRVQKLIRRASPPAVAALVQP